MMTVRNRIRSYGRRITGNDQSAVSWRHPPAKLWSRARLWLVLYLLIVPTVASLVLFSYYPKIDVVFKSFYRWVPGSVLEYTGWSNYLDAMADPIFWKSFQLILILLAANVVKMWPAIIVAIALHRIRSDRWRYIYQVLFVVPMVIPGLVWLLIWKSFYDPDFGLLNRLLNATGLMHVLAWLDGTAQRPGVMPSLAVGLLPIRQNLVQPLFGNTGGMMLLGAMLLTMRERSDRLATRAVGDASLLLIACVPAVIQAGGFTGLSAMVLAMGAAGMLVVRARFLRNAWVPWACGLALGAWALSAQSLWRLPLMMGCAVGIRELLSCVSGPATARQALRAIALGLLAAAALLVVLGMIWVEPTGQFITGTPAWLGNQHLIIPSVIFWGFPWVGTVGVLIYLAGLQQISSDVYEAAELDGVGAIGRLFHIELPLIMTQIRINLIFLTIGTLTSFEFFLILLGPRGGPGNMGMVPGLYMYTKAFIELDYGYACALGMVLFVMLLSLTVFYHLYVKVEK